MNPIKREKKRESILPPFTLFIPFRLSYRYELLLVKIYFFLIAAVLLTFNSVFLALCIIFLNIQYLVCH